MNRLVIFLVTAALLILFLGNVGLTFICCCDDGDCCAGHHPKNISCFCNSTIATDSETIVLIDPIIMGITDPSFLEVETHFPSGVYHPPRTI